MAQLGSATPRTSPARRDSRFSEVTKESRHVDSNVRAPRNVTLLAATATGIVVAQTREKGPWWPSSHGAKDQAGNTNYITAEKILKSLRIPKTGQTYELGRIYEAEMPQYGTVRTS